MFGEREIDTVESKGGRLTKVLAVIMCAAVALCFLAPPAAVFSTDIAVADEGAGEGSGGESGEEPASEPGEEPEEEPGDEPDDPTPGEDNPPVAEDTPAPKVDEPAEWTFWRMLDKKRGPLVIGDTGVAGEGRERATYLVTGDGQLEYVSCLFREVGNNTYKSRPTPRIPAHVTIKGKSYAVTSFMSGAFAGKKVRRVTVGNEVTTVRAKAFGGASSLKRVLLGNSIAKIEGGAFSKAPKLKRVTITSPRLTKDDVKGCLRKSKVKVVKITGVAPDIKKQYKKWFASKKLVGKKVKVK